MKKNKQAFTKRMQFIAMFVMAIVAVLAFATDWQIATGVTSAFALVIGSITLEGKEEEMYNALKGTIQSETEKLTKGYITEAKMLETIGAKIKELDFNLDEMKAFTDLKSVLESQGLQLKKLQDNGIKDEYKSTATQIKEQMLSRKEELSQFKSGALHAFDFVFKVAAQMTGPTNSGAPAFSPEQWEAGVTPIHRYKPNLLEAIPQGNSDKETYSYIQMVNPDGAAAIQADGTLAPLIDFDVAKVTTTAVDSVARVDISEDMLDDFAGLATIVDTELKYKIDLAAENSIYTIITTAAGAFVMTTLKVIKPNLLDVIRACVTQIEENGFGMADTVVLRPSDWFNLISAKDNNANYVMLQIVTRNGTVVDDLKVVKSTTSGITAGNILVFDSRKVNFLNYKPYSAQLGYINDNFGKFIMTIRGKRRFHKFIKTNDVGSFVYDAIATIKTAITAAP